MIEYNSLEHKIDQYKKAFSSVIAWELVEKFSIIFLLWYKRTAVTVYTLPVDLFGVIGHFTVGV